MVRARFRPMGALPMIRGIVQCRRMKIAVFRLIVKNSLALLFIGFSDCRIGWGMVFLFI
jgi:hypothetical protein